MGAYWPRANQAEWTTLWSGDLAWFQANYRKLFDRDLTPPDWASSVDLEASLSVDKSWPGYQVAHETKETTNILVDERRET